MTNNTNRNNPPIQFIGSQTTPEGKIIPDILLRIQQYWRDKAIRANDDGDVVAGAMVEFTFRGQAYIMPPISRWQGCNSWEYCLGEIILFLKILGATDISYYRGVIDYSSY